MKTIAHYGHNASAEILSELAKQYGFEKIVEVTDDKTKIEPGVFYVCHQSAREALEFAAKHTMALTNQTISVLACSRIYQASNGKTIHDFSPHRMLGLDTLAERINAQQSLADSAVDNNFLILIVAFLLGVGSVLIFL